jgi:hypothetical protein
MGNYKAIAYMVSRKNASNLAGSKKAARSADDDKARVGTPPPAASAHHA